MDLASSLADIIWSPAGAFADIPPSPASPPTESLQTEDLSAEAFPELFEELPNPKWRIDGCDGQGVQFFALPVFLLPNLTPLRIDVFIPDQLKHPPGLRKALDSTSTFCVRDERVAGLGISKLILHVLERWTAQYDDFKKVFNALPFGSRIVVENISANIEDIKVHIISDYKTERQLLSVEALQKMWNLPDGSWPTALDLNQLQHQRQLHDTISLVRIPSQGTEELFVFKSTVNEAKYLYHELKLLLSMPCHPNIMPPPLFLVSRKDRYGGADKIYGFILQYHSRGNLADTLAYRAQNGTLQLRDQFHWAKQITSTLITINQGPAKFYSELKADNLILAASESGPLHNVVFIDFEQMGNWITFSAPEVHYLEYLVRLCKSEAVPPAKRERYIELAEEHMAEKADQEPIYANPLSGYYRPWISFTPAERESAEVFSLGKTLWCIFEGCSDTRNSVLKAFKHESGLEFPEFRQTPNKIRKLIEMCTKGNRDGEPQRVEIVRHGAKFYPRGRSGVNGEPEGTASEAREAAKVMWQQRIEEMERFLEAKRRWSGGQRTEEDEALLGYPTRPSLEEVLAELEEAEAELL